MLIVNFESLSLL